MHTLAQIRLWTSFESSRVSVKEPKKGSYSSLGGKNKSEWKDIIYNRKLNDVSINGWNELNNINISYLFEHTRSFYYVVQCRINNFDCREKWTLKVDSNLPDS